MEKSRKLNWTKEEECTLINEIDSAGEILRGSGNSANINKKKKQLWKDIATKVNSVYGNNRAIEDIRKKWNNLKLVAKSKVDASFREARKTGGGSNSSGIIDDEDILILAADKNLTNSDRVRDMFETTPAFSGISGAVDNFAQPAAESSQPTPQRDSVEDTAMLGTYECDVPTTYQIGKKSRKRRRISADDERPTEIQQQVGMRAADLLPLQQEVLFQQMAVFSAQLQLIEEQREYYKLKRQRLLEKP